MARCPRGHRRKKRDVTEGSRSGGQRDLVGDMGKWASYEERS